MSNIDSLSLSLSPPLSLSLSLSFPLCLCLHFSPACKTWKATSLSLWFLNVFLQDHKPPLSSLCVCVFESMCSHGCTCVRSHACMTGEDCSTAFKLNLYWVWSATRGGVGGHQGSPGVNIISNRSHSTWQLLCIHVCVCVDEAFNGGLTESTHGVGLVFAHDAAHLYWQPVVTYALVQCYIVILYPITHSSIFRREHEIRSAWGLI